MQFKIIFPFQSKTLKENLEVDYLIIFPLGSLSLNHYKLTVWKKFIVMENLAEILKFN